MEWLKDRPWAEIILVGVVDLLIAIVGTAVVHQALGHSLVKDVGIVAIWVAAIAGGSFVIGMGRTVQRDSTSRQSKPEQAPIDLVFGSLDQGQTAAAAHVRDELAVVYRASGEDAFTQASRILHLDLIEPMQWDPDPARAQVASLVKFYVLGGHEKERLDLALNQERIGSDELQDRFADFYEKYLRILVWVQRLAVTRKITLGELRGYPAWRKNDDDFMARLREVVPRVDFQRLYVRFKQQAEPRRWIDDESIFY